MTYFKNIAFDEFSRVRGGPKLKAKGCRFTAAGPNGLPTLGSTFPRARGKFIQCKAPKAEAMMVGSRL